MHSSKLTLKEIFILPDSDFVGHGYLQHFTADWRGNTVFISELTKSYKI